MKITVVGTGYVGLVTGACLAEMGNHVVCLDVDAAQDRDSEGGRHPDPRTRARRGRPAQRRGRAPAVHDRRRSGRGATARMQFIAVGTPPDEDGSADLQYVLAAARNIGRRMTDYKVVVDKSTVPVGTADKVRRRSRTNSHNAALALDFAVVVQPRVPEGRRRGRRTSCGPTASSSVRPTRRRAVLLMRALYAPFMRNHDRMLVMDVRSAEFTKYAANAMLATRISFMNELALLAEEVGADIEQVRVGIGSRPAHRHPLPLRRRGLRRCCFPKDVKALVAQAATSGVASSVLMAAWRRPTSARSRCWSTRSSRVFGEDLRGKTFALWGLAFKPNTDDMREAPSRVVHRAN